MKSEQPTRDGRGPIDRADEAHSDDPRQAIEAGEPKIAGHTQGHVADDHPDDVGGASRSRRPGDDDRQHWESGRQDAL